ncbi:MAG: hypothetical protein M3Z24_10565 [Chloroflexota bacterium]|nr:hypothetical protein [Chloroflexota bacterium]
MPQKFLIAEAKTHNPLILQKKTSFVKDFDYTLASYSGCTYGCSYCYVPVVQHGLPDRRGGWGNYVDIRSRCIESLLKQREKLTGASIFMSATTDPYQPVEAQYRLTRAVLETLAEIPFGFLLISTRSGLVLRDIDLFTDPRLQGRVEIGISIPSDMPEIHAALEPKTALFIGRFTIARRLRDAGIPTRIHAAPLAMHSADFVQCMADSAHWIWFDGAGHGAKTVEPGKSLLYDLAETRRFAREAARGIGKERVGFGRVHYAWRWDRERGRIVPPLERKILD